MKRRIIAITLVFVFVFSCFIVPTNAMAKKPKKYTKVKTATYQKYKKAYDAQPGLKKKISNLELKLKNKETAYKKATNEIAKLKEENQKLKEENANITSERDDAKSMNSWLWNNIHSIGITYKNKVWTIPIEFPEKFIIDSATYTVKLEEE